jgi:molybdopterin synthase sulfur carrier subunit
MNTIVVRYFASIREKLGKSTDTVVIDAPMCVADVWRRVCSEPLPANTLAAVNQEYVTLKQQVNAGDEVAFFPPVTGG